MNPTFSLLLVDDDFTVEDTLHLLLRKSSWRLISVKTEAEIPQDTQFHAAFVDMHLTGDLQKAEGVGVLERLRGRDPLTELVAISGDLSLPLMENCLNAGAKKFLAKPLVGGEVTATLEKIEALWRLREIEHRPGAESVQWIGRSAVSESLKSQIARLHGEKGPILVEGETGTGKEVVSRLLHQHDPTRPFIPVNVGAIPENLFESELFGHVKGAFTGADQMKIGLAEAASGGDLFLDEIEALPLAQQAKLLRFLESGEIRKVGGKEITRPHVRVIAASNQNLENLVKEGKFRDDLLFRLKAKKIQLPPLRERLEDLEALAQHFLSQEKPRSNKSFAPEAFAAMRAYAWPGNIRELKRVCEQLTLISPLPVIRGEDVRQLLGLEPLREPDRDPAGLQAQVDAFESQLIQKTLNECGDVDSAANKLKVSRSNLYKKIKYYGLEVPS